MFRKTVLRILLMLCVTQYICAQNRPSEKDFVHYFNIDEKESKAQELLQSAYESSDFILLGETHGSSQISQFVANYATDWSKYGFQQFIAEVGPISGEILNQYMNEQDDFDSYKLFVNRFKQPYDYGYPIPFFYGQEDLAMLSSLAKNQFILQGIDQEFLYGYPHLFAQLKKASKSTYELDSCYSNLKVFVDSVYLRDENGYSYNMYEALLLNDTVKSFYDAIEPLSDNALKIKESIIQSLHIYNASRKRQPSHLMRITYMRSQFERIFESNPNDKYVIKLGRIHAGKNRQLNAYDVGHLIQQLCKTNNKKAVHIGFLRGHYRVSNDEIKNYGEVDQAESFLLNSYAKQDKWTLIDLSELESAIENGIFNLPKDYTAQYIYSYLENYHYLLIPPLDQKQKDL